MRKNLFANFMRIQDNGGQIKVVFGLRASQQIEAIPLSVVKNILDNRQPAYFRNQGLTENDLKNMRIAVNEAEKRQSYIETNTIP